MTRLTYLALFSCGAIGASSVAAQSIYERYGISGDSGWFSVPVGASPTLYSDASAWVGRFGYDSPGEIGAAVPLFDYGLGYLDLGTQAIILGNRSVIYDFVPSSSSTLQDGVIVADDGALFEFSAGLIPDRAYMVVGHTTTGSLVAQSGSTSRVLQAPLDVGIKSGSSGSVTLGSGVTVSKNTATTAFRQWVDFRIGIEGGAELFIQGADIAVRNLRIGVEATGWGVASMTTGNLSAERLDVGVAGNGSFTQTGGQISVTTGSSSSAVMTVGNDNTRAQPAQVLAVLNIGGSALFEVLGNLDQKGAAEFYGSSTSAVTTYGFRPVQPQSVAEDPDEVLGSTVVRDGAELTVGRFRQQSLALLKTTTATPVLTRLSDPGTAAEAFFARELEIDEGAILNLTTNDLISAESLAILQGYLNNGQIVHAAEVPGQLGENAVLGLTPAEYHPDASTSGFGTWLLDDTYVVGEFTFAGDLNVDGQVNALDYERIDLNVGNSGQGFRNGDANNDGFVDALDYEQVDLHIGNGFDSPSPIVAVPEPSFAIPGALLIFCCALRRTRL